MNCSIPFQTSMRSDRAIKRHGFIYLTRPQGHSLLRSYKRVTKTGRICRYAEKKRCRETLGNESLGCPTRLLEKKKTKKKLKTNPTHIQINFVVTVFPSSHFEFANVKNTKCTFH